MPADALASLVAILETSPATYIADSGIWSYPGDEVLKLALADVVADQRGILDRAAAVLADRDVPAPQTGYPLAYSAWHDLDLAFLLPRIIRGMKRQIEQMEGILPATAGDEAGASLAREAIASTRRHVDVLEQQASRLHRPSAPA